ncbi:hypothetical protein AGMMS50276_17980 [Synergistales bacterium]|nr:hypothetical protein AGMMS50276_17980 [Synergistales bacterium]
MAQSGSRFRYRNSKLPRLRWLILAAPLVVWAFIAGTVFYSELGKFFRLSSAVEERTARLAEKERVVRVYKEQADFYKTQEGVAHLAREHYNLALPGERVYLLVTISEDEPRR